MQRFIVADADLKSGEFRYHNNSTSSVMLTDEHENTLAIVLPGRTQVVEASFEEPDPSYLSSLRDTIMEKLHQREQTERVAKRL